MMVLQAMHALFLGNFRILERVGQTVQRVLQDILTDCSTEDKFEFSIVCEECGKVWKSKAIAFSKARIHPVTEGKKVVYAALYQREKKEAHLKALKAGEKLFSRCPICHRWVCDDCFMVCEDLDMCKQCAERLNEKGSIVG